MRSIIEASKEAQPAIKVLRDHLKKKEMVISRTAGEQGLILSEAAFAAILKIKG